MIITLLGCENADYKKAMEQFNAENYEEALLSFEKLGEYENSLEMIKECYYQIALKELYAENYENAKAQFSLISEYKDASDQIIECDYQTALLSFNRENYQQAISVFEALGDYKNSNEKLIESRYMYGKKLLSDEEYEEAYKQLSLIEEYQDVPNLLIDLSWESLYQYIQKNADGRTSDGSRYIQQILSYNNGVKVSISLQMLTRRDLIVIYETSSTNYGGYVVRQLFTFDRDNPKATFTEYAQQESFLKEVGSVDIEPKTFNENMNIKLDKYYYWLRDNYGYVTESWNTKDAIWVKEKDLPKNFANALRAFSEFLKDKKQVMSLSDLGFMDLQ